MSLRLKLQCPLRLASAAVVACGCPAPYFCVSELVFAPIQFTFPQYKEPGWEPYPKHRMMPAPLAGPAGGAGAGAGGGGPGLKRGKSTVRLLFKAFVVITMNEPACSCMRVAYGSSDGAILCHLAAARCCQLRWAIQQSMRCSA